jgi:hypothetical protein
MQPSRSPQRALQLKLFHPRLNSPCWEQLPPEIRQQIVRALIARASHPIKEARDE